MNIIFYIDTHIKEREAAANTAPAWIAYAPEQNLLYLAMVPVDTPV